VITEDGMDDPFEALAWRLAVGAITPEEFDQSNARLASANSSSAQPRNKAIGKLDVRLTLNDLYRAYREYLNHEHHLINQRLGWNLTVQGFLFAAYGLAFGKIADIEIAISHNTTASLGASLHTLQLGAHLIAFVGISVSVAVLFSVFGAILSACALQKRWTESPVGDQGTLRQMAKAASLPDIMGGGSNWSVLIGFGAPVILPFILAVVWALILFN
jgi:hypothetical protein